jgi:hypothetical protein
MAESLIRGRYLLQKTDPPDTIRLLEEGTLFQRDGLILEVGPYSELKRRHPAAPEIGSTRHLVIPSGDDCLGRVTPDVTAKSVRPFEHGGVGRLRREILPRCASMLPPDVARAWR